MEEVRHPHPWKARIITSIVLLLGALLGLIVTDVDKDGGWFYWRIITPIYALIAIGLSWYLRKKKHSLSFVKLWHEVLHWIGLMLAVYLVSRFVSIGLMGRFEAGLMVLSMLALTTFLAGIYIEISFIFIGLLLGFGAYVIAFLDQYLYAIILPVIAAGAAVIIGLIYYQKRKSEVK